MSNFIWAGTQLGLCRLSWKKVGHGCSQKGFCRYGVDAIWFTCYLEEHDSFFLILLKSPCPVSQCWLISMEGDKLFSLEASTRNLTTLSFVPPRPMMPEYNSSAEGRAWLHPPSRIKNRGLHGITGEGRSQVQNKIQLEEVGLINRLI